MLHTGDATGVRAASPARRTLADHAVARRRHDDVRSAIWPADALVAAGGDREARAFFEMLRATRPARSRSASRCRITTTSHDWPAPGRRPHVICTEKDAVKLWRQRARRAGSCRCVVRTGVLAVLRRARRKAIIASMDTKLLELLVCPVTKGPLDLEPPRSRNCVSRSARLAYPGARRHPGDARRRGAHACPTTSWACSLTLSSACVHRPHPGAARVDPPARQAAGRHRRRCRWSCASPSAPRSPAPRASWSRPTTRASSPPASAHGVAGAADAHRPRQRQRPPRRGLRRCSAWTDDDIVVNVQGDEPLIEPALIDAVARLLADAPRRAMSTAAHAIESPKTSPTRTSSRWCSMRRAARSTSAARRSRGGATASPRWARTRCRLAAAAAPHRPLRLSRRLPAALSRPAAGAGRDDRSARAAARAVARRPHRGARHRGRAGPGRRHAGRSGARARASSPPTDSRAASAREPHAILDAIPPANSPRAAAWRDTNQRTFRGHHETDSVGRPRRGQRHASGLHLPEVRHPADLDRRHAARRRQGRHAAGPAGARR